MLIPAELPKDAATIELPVRADRHDCHDTTLWYRRVIQPLFPRAKRADHTQAG
ncbi:hypothetical protein [Limimaricola soesokkakensis]|uniref:hypothetical protein n=1 Tax=Limimaricola soesokkakensis TaxID=1343159 RepID=UPI00351734FA